MIQIHSKVPAKINIGLFITGKRNDGYHSIETVFYPVRIYDELIISKSDIFLFSTNSASLSGDYTNNLVFKAVKLLANEVFEKDLPVSIRLNKSIPMGAGLGGGSADAAFTLKAVNRLLNLKIPAERLKQLALKIGSDVPFFLNPRPHFGSSRGEVLIPLNFSLGKPLLIVNPGIHVSTKWAYEHCTPTPAPFDLRKLDGFNGNDIATLNNYVHNDFEEIVCKNFQQIAELRYELNKSHAIYVSMSGSGSTFFAVYNDVATAKKAYEQFSGKYFTHLEGV